jgi:hypothetical protein
MHSHPAKKVKGVGQLGECNPIHISVHAAYFPHYLFSISAENIP